MFVIALLLYSSDSDTLFIITNVINVKLSSLTQHNSVSFLNIKTKLRVDNIAIRVQNFV